MSYVLQVHAFLQQMEAAPRARKQLSEFVFTAWERAAEI